MIDEDLALQRLLVPLSEVEPVQMPKHGRMRRRRPVLVGALVAAALIIVGVSIASGLGGLAGISAADHPPTARDALDPVTALMVRRMNRGVARFERVAGAHAGPGLLLADSARRIGMLPSGHAIYVLSTTLNHLCVVVERSALACGSSLGLRHPVTIEVTRRGPRTPPLSYGVALDGVTSLSFRAGGRIVTVPIRDNVWAYEGSSSVLAQATVHYASGRSQELVDGRLQR
jgi:hypothetical protein